MKIDCATLSAMTKYILSKFYKASPSAGNLGRKPGVTCRTSAWLPAGQMQTWNGSKSKTAQNI